MLAGVAGNIWERCFWDVLCSQKQSMSGELYRQDCIRKRFKPFLEQHHSDGDYWFWPELATGHYAKVTLKVLSELDIPTMPKDCNPPNCPQIRPVEDLWAALKCAVYEGGWEARTKCQLKQRTHLELSQMDVMIFQRPFQTVHNCIWKIADNGPLATIHWLYMRERTSNKVLVKNQPVVLLSSCTFNRLKNSH